MLTEPSKQKSSIAGREVAFRKTLNVQRLQCVEDRHEYHLDILQTRYGWSRAEAQAELERRLQGYLHLHVQVSDTNKSVKLSSL